MPEAVFLLGAGASFGSGDAKPEPPPLGKYLFRSLVKLAGAASNLQQAFGDLFNRNFEEGMAELQRANRVNDIHALHRDIAQFLADFQPGPRNIYFDFLKLVKKNSLIVTLNYDLLLEMAAGMMGHRVSYTRWGQACLQIVKLHGSINWWHDEDQVSAKFVDAHQHYRINTQKIKFLDIDALRNRLSRQNYSTPVMATYQEGKPVYSCENFIGEQRSVWTEATKAARVVFVIGVALNQADSHIWHPLEATTAKIIYFAHSATDIENASAWIKNLEDRRMPQAATPDVTVVKAGFRESLVHLRRNMFI